MSVGNGSHGMRQTGSGPASNVSQRSHRRRLRRRSQGRRIEPFGIKAASVKQAREADGLESGEVVAPVVVVEANASFGGLVAMQVDEHGARLTLQQHHVLDRGLCLTDRVAVGAAKNSGDAEAHKELTRQQRRLHGPQAESHVDKVVPQHAVAPALLEQHQRILRYCLATPARGTSGRQGVTRWRREAAVAATHRPSCSPHRKEPGRADRGLGNRSSDWERCRPHDREGLALQNAPQVVELPREGNVTPMAARNLRKKRAVKDAVAPRRSGRGCS